MIIVRNLTVHKNTQIFHLPYNINVNTVCRNLQNILSAFSLICRLDCDITEYNGR